MKSKDIVGRRIVKVNQTRFYASDQGCWFTEIHSFELDNGKFLVLHPQEDESGPFCEAAVVGPKTK